MRKIVSVFLALMLAAVLVGCGGKPDLTSDDYKFDNLQTQINALKIQNEELQAQLDNLDFTGDNVVITSQEVINDLYSQIAANTALIGQLQIDLDATGDDLTALEKRVFDLEGIVKDLQTQITILQRAVAALQTAGRPGALVFTGYGNPNGQEFEGLVVGDYYISLKCGDENKGERPVYEYLGSYGWVETGKIKVNVEQKSVVVE